MSLFLIPKLSRTNIIQILSRFSTAWLQVTIEHCLVSTVQAFSSMNEADNLLKSLGNTAVYMNHVKFRAHSQSVPMVTFFK